MSDVNANIDININSSNALAQLKSLQRQIAQFHTSIAKSSESAALAQRGLQKNLLNSINAINGLTAEMRTVKTSAESFTNSLEKNKFSMREYFRYAGASTKTFGRLFKSEFDTIGKVAEERVKRLQTQYIKMGRDANGAMQAIAITPTSLNMQDYGTKTAIAAQKQALFNQLMKQGSTNLLNFGKNTQWAGRQLMVGFTIPLAMVGSAATKTFMEMEAQAIKFKKVYGDLFTPKEETQEALDNVTELGKAFTKYGVAVSTTVGLAAEAAAAGFSGLDLQRQTTEATRLSILGQIDSQKALETTISLQNAFGMSSEKLAGSIDFLNAVENQTVVSLDDITTAIPKVAPVIQQLGGDVKDLTFFMAAMKEGGINASEGANALKSGLAALINPTGRANEMLKGFGINANEIVTKNKGDLKATVIEFAEALNALDPLNRAQAIEQMFGKFQFARLSTLFANVAKDGNQAARVLDLANSSVEELSALSEQELGMTAESAMNKFKKTVEDLKIALVPVGKAFLEAVTPIVEFVGNILEKFGNLSDGTKKVITLLTVGIGAVGPVLLMTFGLLANGVANIIKLFLTLRGGYQRLTGQSQILGEQTQYMTMEQIDAAAAAHSLNQTHATLTQTFTAEASAIQKLIAAYSSAATASANFARANPGMMMPGRIGKKFAQGGMISGPGGPTSDSVPIMASNGEAIISAETVKKYPGIINGLISGNIPGFRRAGKVGGDKAFRLQDSYELGHFAPAMKMTGAELQEFAKTQTQSVKDTIDRLINSVQNGLEHAFDVFSNEVVVQSTELNQAIGEVGSGKRAPAELFRQEAVTGAGAYNAPLLAKMKDAGASSEEIKNAVANLAKEFDEGITKLGDQTTVTAEEINKITQEAYDNVAKTNKQVRAAREELRKPGAMKEQFGAVKTGGRTQFRGAYNSSTNRRKVNDVVQEQLPGRFPTQQGGKFTAAAAQEAGIIDATAIKEIYTKLSNETKKMLDSYVGDIKLMSKKVVEEARKAGIDIGKYTIEGIKKETRAVRQPFANSPEFVPKTDLRGSGSYRGTISNYVTQETIRKNEEHAKRLADAAIASTAKAAGTQSPSKRTIPIGEDIARGLEVGMANRQDDVALAGSQLSQAATGGTSRGSRRASFRPQGAPGNIGISDPALLAMAYQENAMRDKLKAQAASTHVMTQRMDKLNKGFMAGTFALSSLSGVASMAGGNLGKFSQIIFQLTGPLFALSSIIQLLTGNKIMQYILRFRKVLGPVALGITALTIAGKFYLSAREKERQQTEAFTNVLKSASKEAEFLANKFNIIRKKGIGESFSVGAPNQIVVSPTRAKMNAYKDDKDFQDTFADTISGTKNLTLKKAEAALTLKGLQLISEGVAKEEVQIIIDTIKEQAGKQELRLDFSTISLTGESLQNVGKQLSSSVSGFSKEFEKEFLRAETYLKKFDKNVSMEKIIKGMSNDQVQPLKDAGAAVASYSDSIFKLAADGGMNLEQFNTAFSVLFNSINNKVPQSNAKIALLKTTLTTLSPELAETVAGVKDFGKLQLILQAAAAGVGGTLISQAASTYVSAAATEAAAEAAKKAGQSTNDYRDSLLGLEAARRAVAAADTSIESEIARILKVTKTLNDELKKAFEDLNREGLKKENPLLKRTKEIENQTNAYKILRKAKVDNTTATELSNDAEIAALVIAKNRDKKLKDVITLVNKYKAALKEQTKAAKENMSQDEKFRANLTRTLAIASLRENLIDLQYASQLKTENDQLDRQQKELEGVNDKIKERTKELVDPLTKQLDANNFALEKISLQEDAINEKYDIQTKALEKIKTLNQDISNVQKQRIGIADALTSGNVSQAVQLIQDARAQRAESAASRQQDSLTANRDAAIGALGRTKLEKENKQLQYDISVIEKTILSDLTKQKTAIEDQIDTTQRAITKIELQVETLKNTALYAGQTKKALEDQDELIRLADAAGIEYNNTLIKQLANAQGIEAAIKALNTTVNTIHNIKTVTSGASESTSSVPAGVMLGGTFVPLPKKETPKPATRTGTMVGGTFIPTNYKSKGGLIPKYMARGGKAIGSDTVPAMLTPGEFIVNRAAASANGPMLKALNESKYPSMLAQNSSSTVPIVNNSTSLNDNSTAVYNYTLGFNINGSTSNPNDIAKAVIKEIKQIDSQRIRGSRR